MAQPNQNARPNNGAITKGTPTPLTGPSSGLGSNSNYFIFSPGEKPGTCNNLQGLEIIINVTEDIVPSNGFGFQLNAYSPSPYAVFAQQYTIFLDPTVSPPQLSCNIDNGPAKPSNVLFSKVLAKLADYKLPAGYSLSIFLWNNPSENNGAITGATYVAKDNMGTIIGDETLSLLPYPSDLAPVVTFQVNLVGYGRGTHTNLSSGAGTMTFSALNSLMVQSTFPSCAAEHYITLETANSVYGELYPGPSKTITQTFKAG